MERSRSRSETSEPTSYKYEVKTLGESCAGGDVPVFSTFAEDAAYTEMSTQSSMTDVVTPEWNRKRNQGMIINNPMSKVTQVDWNPVCPAFSDYAIEFNDCSPKRWRTINSVETFGTIPSSMYLQPYGGDISDLGACLPAVPAYDVQDQVDLAVNKAWSKVGLDETYLLTTLGESQKTVASITAIFSRFLRVLRSLKRLKAREVLHELSGKQLQDRYMELRYAIRPLVYDYNGAVAALQKQTSALHDRLTFRGHDSELIANWFGTDMLWQSHSDQYGTFEKYVQKLEQYQVHIDVRAGVLTQLETKSQLPVWGLTMPVEAAWELTPFSFILDWFFNIGDTITAWTPNFGLRSLASWYTVTVTQEQSAKCTDSWATMVAGTDPNRRPLRHDLQLTPDCQVSRTIVTKQRVPNPTRAIAPSLDLRLNALKLADLLIIGKKLVR